MTSLCKESAADAKRMVAILAASGEDGEASVQDQPPADDDSGNSLDVVKFVLQRALDDRNRWNKIKRRELERQESGEEKDLPQNNDDDQNHARLTVAVKKSLQTMIRMTVSV